MQGLHDKSTPASKSALPSLGAQNKSVATPVVSPTPHASPTPHVACPSPDDASTSISLTGPHSPLSPLFPPNATPRDSPPPSENHVTPSTDHQGSAQTPTIPATTNSDKRVLIVEVQPKSFDPSKLVLNELKQVVYSHFDGPHIRWTWVPPTTLDQWWRMFKCKVRWDETKFSEVFVRKTFNHVGAKNLRAVMQRAKKDKKRPVWMKEEIWDECLVLWQKEDYLRQVELNKANRAVATAKGIPSYRGGSVSITIHKRRLRDENKGVDPTPQETFERCYKKKNGTWSDPLGVGPQAVGKFQDLVVQATQEVDEASQGSHSIDQNRLWIEPSGVVKKEGTLGMGSEAESMMEMTQYVHHPTPISAIPTNDTFKDDVMNKISNIELQLSLGLTNLEKRLDNSVKSARIEANLNLDIVQKNMQQNMDNVQQNMQKNMDNVQENLQQELDLWEKKLDMFITKIGGYFQNKSSSK